jgi:epoxide hydrolase 4
MYLVNTVLTGTDKIEYLQLGSANKDAPIALLLHGFPGNAFDWSPQFESLGKHCRIIAPFMPGVRDGEIMSDDRYATTKIVAALQTLLDTVDPSRSRPVFIIGHDLGCFFAQALSDQLGSRVRAVVYINGMGLQQYFHRLRRVSTWWKSFYVLLFQIPLIRLLVARWIPKQILPVIYRKCGLALDDPKFLNDERVLASIAIYARLFREIWSYRRQPIRRRAQATLFIWGNADRFLALPRRSEVARFYEDATIRVVRGGHWVSRSASVQVNAIVGKFLGLSANNVTITEPEGRHASI